MQLCSLTSNILISIQDRNYVSFGFLYPQINNHTTKHPSSYHFIKHTIEVRISFLLDVEAKVSQRIFNIII